MKFNHEKVQQAYLRFNQLADNLTYRKQKREEFYEVRSNSRVIISNLTDEEDCDYIVMSLNLGVEGFLNDEYDKFIDKIQQKE